MKNLRRGLICLALAFSSVAWPRLSAAQSQSGGASSPAEASLPDAPQAQQGDSSSAAGVVLAGGPVRTKSRYARVVEPGETPAPLPGDEKLIFSLYKSANAIIVVSSLYSAGYEQLTENNPKYGSDSGAFAAKFGASLLRSASVNFLSDGVFATAFHQDPHYHRIAHGKVFFRGVHSAEQALVRRGDDGDQQFNSSGLAGRAAAALLTLAYYPPASRTARVVGTTFGVSVATDAGGNLVLEFFPDLAHRFPFLKKLEVQ